MFFIGYRCDGLSEWGWYERGTWLSNIEQLNINDIMTYND